MSRIPTISCHGMWVYLEDALILDGGIGDGDIFGHGGVMTLWIILDNDPVIGYLFDDAIA